MDVVTTVTFSDMLGGLIRVIHPVIAVNLIINLMCLRMLFQLAKAARKD